MLDYDYYLHNFSYPLSQKQLFCRYLRLVKHPAPSVLEYAKVTPIQTTWQTNNNVVDCGVFLMRHMETFDGTTDGKWSCGFVEESAEQDRQLHRLRRKYATKILTSEENTLKAKVLEESETFAKWSKEAVKEVNAHANKIRHERVESNRH